MFLKNELVTLSWITATTAAAAFRNPTYLSRYQSFVHAPAGIWNPPISPTHSSRVVRRMSTAPSDMTSLSRYWNREDATPTTYTGPVMKSARILSLSDPEDPNNIPLHQGTLPDGADLLAIGTTLESFNVEMLKNAQPNVLFVSHSDARRPLAELLQTFPSLEWVHTRSAGIDFCNSDTLGDYARSGKIRVTNAKGCFSSTLAEYSMLACAYFAKDLPRLLRQQNASEWQKYPILELRGATFGVIGYGDIGRAASKLAKAYGMKIIALRRNPDKAKDDPIVDKVYGNDAASLNRLFEESDYVLCAAPLTRDTEKMIGKEQFDHAKRGCVFINVGRGPIVDEVALVEALQDGRLKGAGLDVTTIEPLPKDSPLWKLENVLLSPHNMDMTETFMKESTEFFVQQNLPRFLHGKELLNPVDPTVGY